MRTPTLLVLVAVLAAAMVALPMSGCGGGETQESEGTAETTERDSEDSSTGTAPGQFPPEFALEDLNGNTVTLADYEGQVVVIDLWATWCPPCREEIPFLVDLYEEHKDKGFVVLGIGLDQGGADVLRKFADENDVTYPVLVGDRAVSSDYRASSIPTTYIVGRDGRIVERHVGFSPAIGAELREAVEQLLSPVEV